MRKSGETDTLIEHVAGSEIPKVIGYTGSKDVKPQTGSLGAIREIVDIGFITRDVYIQRREKQGINAQRAGEEWDIANNIRK